MEGKFAEKSFVLFTRILGLLWHYLKKILRIRILRRVRKIERIFLWANLVLRPASHEESSENQETFYASNLILQPVPHVHRAWPLNWLEISSNLAENRIEYVLLTSWDGTFPIKAGLDIFETNVRIQWNPVYNAFHRIRCCGNETNW